MKSARLRLFSTLFLLIAAIIVVPLVDSLLPNAVIIYIGVLVLCTLWALLQRAWFDVSLCSAVVLVIGFSAQLVPDKDLPTRLLSLYGFMAYIGLNLVLLIGPWTRFIPKLVWLYKHRRHLGVAVFLLGLGHASIIFSFYFSYSLPTLLSYTLPVFGLTALFIMGAMAATSFDKIQKHVNIVQWQVLHTFLLLIYSAIIAFYFSNAGEPIDLTARLFFVSVLVYWVAISPFALPSRVLRYINGWKQLHVLVYAAYASTLLHVWTARVAEEVLYKKIGFFALTVLVIGSHIVGWIVCFVKRHREIASLAALAGNDRTIIGHSEDFVEGIGKKVRINNEDLAVFRHEGNIYAISHRCPHQGGPLSEGKIKNGYVECPWHGHQFGIKDGKGPPEFGDAVQSYPVEEIDGSVYIRYLNEPSKMCVCACVSTKKS